MDFVSITSAYEGLKIGKSILKTVYDSKIEADAKEKIDVVMSKLGEAQDSLFTMREELFRLQSENNTLKEEMANSAMWDTKFAKYELTETAGSAVVYKFLGVPEHYICPSCISQKRIEILQDNRTNSGKFRCVGCNGEFPIKPNRNKSSISFSR